MRISESEREVIKTTVSRFFPGALVYLFGSRVDDAKRGGDLDLLIHFNRDLNVEDILNLKIALKDGLGDQKIDVLTTRDPKADPRPIVTIAARSGVLL